MTKRDMTLKMFLHRSTGKVSASKFLEQHRDFLVNQEVIGEALTLLLEKLDAKGIMPSACLEEIRKVIFSRLIQQSAERQEKQLQRQGKRDLPFAATAYSDSGEVLKNTDPDSPSFGEDLHKEFDSLARARDWLDRQLFKAPVNAYGEVVHKYLLVSGKQLTFRVNRDESLARILRPAPIGAHKNTAKKEASLSWKPTAKGDHCHFSHG